MSLTRVLRVHQAVIVATTPGRAPVKGTVTAKEGLAVTEVEEAAVSNSNFIFFNTLDNREG